MFVRSVKLTNFKGYRGNNPHIRFNLPNGSEGSGLNIFVGENNAGKSTVFEAFDFLRDGIKKKSPDAIKNQHESSCDAGVEVIFCGDVGQTIEAFAPSAKINTFQQCIFDSEGEACFGIFRSTDNHKVVKLWDIDQQGYVNKSGYDAPVKALFENNFFWADTNPGDEVSFGASTLCGSLLSEIVSTFTESEDYLGFSNSFHETFNHENSLLRQELRSIEERTREKFQGLFGDARINFRFDELDVKSFFKKVSIDVDDGVNTAMEEKGSGMQRSVALALLQVYIESIAANPSGGSEKPFFLFIDEPEVCLHPKAQNKLFRSLLELSKYKQVFITTHSPYFLVSEHLRDVGLFIFRNADEGLHIHKLGDCSAPLLPWSPTWGEVNFLAYDLPTPEFHNELYGYLQSLSHQPRLNAFDRWLKSKGILFTHQWQREGADTPNDCSIHTFIRNKLHHPENHIMRGHVFSDDDLRNSIEEMMDLIRQENS